MKEPTQKIMFIGIELVDLQTRKMMYLKYCEICSLDKRKDYQEDVFNQKLKYKTI